MSIGRLIHLLDWLAEQMVGYVDSPTATPFVRRIDRETEIESFGVGPGSD